MPLSRTLSVSSLPGLEDWEDEFDLENTVLFEVAWEVANKGERARRRGPGEKSSRVWGGRGLHTIHDFWVLGKEPMTLVSLGRVWDLSPAPWRDGDGSPECEDKKRLGVRSWVLGERGEPERFLGPGGRF